MDPICVIGKLAKNGVMLQKQMEDAVFKIKLAEHYVKANAVFIKPNLTYPYYKAGVTTRFEFIHDLVQTLSKISEKPKIYIGEGEGGYNSFSMNRAFLNMGYSELEKKFKNVKIVNLSEVSSKKIELKTHHGNIELSLPTMFFDEIDFSISCPVPKVHCMTGISLSYKNLWGCVPDVMRLKYHYVFDKVISRIGEVLKFKYAFLDGEFGLTDNGPMVGTPTRVDWFVASNSLGAFDLQVADMMGINWKRIKHLQNADKYGFLPDKKNITVLGTSEKIKKEFKLNRVFWNYPALLAFHSKNLTHLFYFSKISKILHDIMYLIRKKPIE